MAHLVSPEYSLKAFCDGMLGKDLFSVMTTAAAEISLARRIHRETTKASDFRKGSKGREYCDGLQSLISMLMNGAVPVGASQSFLVTVKPLFVGLLQKSEIGTLRQVFSGVADEARPSLLDIADPLVVVVSRAEVESIDTSVALNVLKQLLQSPETAERFVERVDIAFHGYDHTNQELFEIPEVRNFVCQLDREFPFWLYFLSKYDLGLQCLLFCFLPSFLTEEARSRILPERIGELLTQRWLPAMNQVCDFAGFSELQIERLSDRAVR